MSQQQRRILAGALLSFCIWSASPTLHAGQRTEHKQEVADESSKIRSVSQGASFQLPLPVEKSFDAALTYLKKQGYSIEVANKDGGEIATSMVVAGGWHQTGTRVLVSLIKETDSTTTLRVAVTSRSGTRRFRSSHGATFRVCVATGLDGRDILRGGRTRDG